MRKFDTYPVLRPLLFQIDPEITHHMAVTALKWGLGPRLPNDIDPLLHTDVCGLSFANPLGLAAGFDKQAEAMKAMFGFGFGAIELGSITPQPQPGNPKPRLFRIPQAKAIINRFGFNSDGFNVCRARIEAYDKATATKRLGILGINIGKNKESADAAGDYMSGISTFAPYADYLTVNISSPNTPGLRDLQGREQMAALMKACIDARNAVARKPPLFVKIAPDLSEKQMNEIAEVTMNCGIDGIIIGNTTVSRPPSIPDRIAKQSGGLSGKPLFAMSTDTLRRIYKLTQGKITLIGCGGVSSGADAYAKIKAGASLVQIYTALIYEGPMVVTRINRELAELLRRDGFKSVGEAVGKDNP